MKHKHLSCILFFVALILLSGCATKRATLKTFIDPSIQSSSVKTVAVFQMRNTSFSPGETMEIDRNITQAFVRKNNSSKLIGAAEAGTMLNDAKLADEYAKFLRDFELSGIANTAFLNKIKMLGIDVILQGNMSGVSQEDRMRVQKAKTTLTIRYTLLDTENGKILWEGTSNATMQWNKRFAPPLYEVATMAQNKINSSIPTLGK